MDFFSNYCKKHRFSEYKTINIKIYSENKSIFAIKRKSKTQRCYFFNDKTESKHLKLNITFPRHCNDTVCLFVKIDYHMSQQVSVSSFLI